MQRGISPTLPKCPLRMKTVFICACFILFIVNCSFAQSDWIGYKIDSKLSIEVPAEPEKADEYSVGATGKDSLVCAITKIEMQKVSAVASATLVEIAPPRDFAEVIKSGMLQPLK